MYSPDRWSILKYKTGELAILAGWNGPYVEPDEWRRSSPITKVKRNKGHLEAFTTSSYYLLNKDRYGLTPLTRSIWASMEFQMEIVPIKAVTLLTKEEAMKELNERFK